MTCKNLKKGDLTGYNFCIVDDRKVTEEYCKQCKFLKDIDIEIEKSKSNLVQRIMHYFGGAK